MNFIRNKIKTKRLKQNHTKHPDFVLFLLASMLIISSMLFSYSLSVYTVTYFEYNQFHFFSRQFGVGIVAILIMWYFSQISADKLIGRMGWFLFGTFSFLIMIMPFLPPVLVTASGGANRWIRLPGFSLSPVEFFKIGFIYFLAWSFHRRVSHKPKTMNYKEELFLVLPYFGAFAIAVFFIAFMQKDLGNIFLLFTILFILLIFANRSFKLFLPLIAIAVIGFVILILAAPHRIKRIQGWWSMVQDTVLSFMPDFVANALRIKEFPEPYQVSHSLNAIHNGGFSGTGIGEGSLKLGFLSEVHTDFVLAGITEELGLIGFIIIVSTLLLIVWRIFRISRRVENPIYHLFTLGVGLMIVVAFIINSYGISGMIPIKGIAVPFLSYGGSSLLSVAVAIGLVLSISREANS